MATKSFDAGLEFISPSKIDNRGAGWLGMFRTVFEAFEEGRDAEAKYRELVARGMGHEAAARAVFAGTYKN